MIPFFLSPRAFHVYIGLMLHLGLFFIIDIVLLSGLVTCLFISELSKKRRFGLRLSAFHDKLIIKWNVAVKRLYLILISFEDCHSP